MKVAQCFKKSPRNISYYFIHNSLSTSPQVEFNFLALQRFHLQVKSPGFLRFLWNFAMGYFFLKQAQKYICVEWTPTQEDKSQHWPELKVTMALLLNSKRWGLGEDKQGHSLHSNIKVSLSFPGSGSAKPQEIKNAQVFFFIFLSRSNISPLCTFSSLKCTLELF